jgi:hypothetical protein
MRFPKGEMVVLDLAGDVVRVHCSSGQRASLLLGNGFVEENGEYVRQIGNDVTSQKELTRWLMSHEALFSEGHGWSPAALVDHFRENGWVSGRFRTIGWVAPDQFVIGAQ